MNNEELDVKIVEYRKKHENVILLSAGEYSEDLIEYITDQLDDEALDTMDVYRELERQDDLAAEPITAAVLIGVPSVIAVGRIIERWIEKRRQAENLKLVLKAYKISESAGKGAAEVAGRHSEIDYQLAEPSGGLPV
jgi:hypothetical protein